MQAPCREADTALVECPNCERPVQIRWLKYGHICGRTFNVQQRAVEGIARAEQQFRERVAPDAAVTDRVHRERAEPNAAPVKDWSRFLANAF